MGNIPGGMGGPGGPGGGDKKKQDKSKKKGPAPPPAHFGRRKKRVNKGPPGMSKIPTVVPTGKCRLRMLKLDRIKDYLLMEEEFINRQEAMKVGGEDRTEEERNKVDEIRGKPISVGNLEELIDDSHAIVSTSNGPEFYVNILSIVDQDQLEPGSSVLLHNKLPPGVILYGAPGTGKTLLAKAVANETSATFLRVVGSELIQKYLGDGPKLVREMFRVANEQAPSIVFIDEIDAVGTKRYDTTSGGEREIQRTMLELLNQLDGFDQSADVKVILATNKIESLDPALLRPGRIDRKIEFPLPDINTKRRIFQIHTSKMTLADDVDLEEFVHSKDDLSGADIKAICTEAGMLALRERRMRVTAEDLRKAREKALYRKKGNIPEGMYL
ncbi:26S protease regulatory subunit, putative [Perkinsus marinus ATCC 50983]|uniref:26S protease regulatory subunit, putative n=1 Tax=Perkinsus marinus (strain ATCC 50983 / TXsc) TaxID=423536 RepID=C5KQQ5_PERM5|nr:26S protease regulatory subunit, putative [Perkinsus marinus ATCC 50983]EER13151.1 26S protease regulatory subunit, putative [Perkinsus marinus ATCC 50983]|eukprot:XP_002781356.1 26S protease regulatory subunit, putative [Perkinsus marinus ATCC 50983]